MTQRPRPIGLSDPIVVGGRSTTVRESILESLRNGMPGDVAYARSAVKRQVMHDWMRAAAKATVRAALDPGVVLSAHELDLIEFADEVDMALAEGEARFTTAMASLAMGGRQKVTTTIKVERDVQGREKELERYTKTEVVLPSFNALKWVLENRYGRRLLLVSDVAAATALLSVEERAELMTSDVERWLSERAAVPADQGEAS